MSIEKFTKGEWSEGKTSLWHSADTIQINSNGAQIFNIESMVYCDDEAAANAQLIAQAPAMYQMLNSYMELVKDDRAEDFLYKFKEIERLLAKARGEL